MTGDQPGRRDPGHRVPGAIEGREEGEHRRARRGRRAQPERRLGRDRERALAADEEVGQRVARHVLDVLAAGPDHAPVGHHDLERQDRIARLAVLDAAQAAGVGAQVAADRAHLEAGRVGRVEEALGGDRGLELRVDDPRLDDGDEVLPVDLDDLVHRREDDRQPVLDAGRAARQPGPRPARDDRDAQLARRSGPARRRRRSWSGRRRPAAGRRGGTGSRRRGSPRGRGRRSGAGGRGGALSIAATSGSVVVAAGVWWVVTRRVYAAEPSLEWRRGYDGADVPAHAVDPRGPPDRHHRRLRAGRRAGPTRSLSRPRTVRARRSSRSRPRSSSPTPPPPRSSPGSVDRTSLFVDATYDASLRISWGTRKIAVDSTATIRNTSGAPIDRIELNTIAARLGSIQLHSVTVDGVATGATRSDQTIVVPLGGILPVDATTRIRVRFHATASQQPVRLELAVRQGERDHRPLPLAAVGQPQDRLRPAEPRRPVRDAVEPLGGGQDRDLASAGAGDERRPDRRSAPTA